MSIQKFSYHTHTNTFGVYDGRYSISEMLTQAEKIGYEEIGISNHICCHPNMKEDHSQFFSNPDKALDIYKRTIEEIRKETENFKLKVLVGFEVDYFPSQEWRKFFEEGVSKLDMDYLIGATHFLRDDKEENIINTYMLHLYRSSIADSDFDVMLKNYWLNIIESIKSGYFDFIAHLDVCRVHDLCLEDKWLEYKYKVIEALADYKHPYELNTSGITKTGEQHPQTWILKELNKHNVPLVISDDAHYTEHLGQHYAEAEKLLSDIGYKNRWKLYL